MEHPNKMEHLNKVELRGRVGNVSQHKIGDDTLVKLAVATNYVFRDKEGSVCIETTWHYVTAWTHNIHGAVDIVKGDDVWLTGRIRRQKYTDANGDEHDSIDILANDIQVIAK